jgi:uncharacterized GH25 family protein
MFLKMSTYFVQPDEEFTLSLYNGTFEKSEAILTRERMRDASLVSEGNRVAIEKDRWIYRDSTLTQLKLQTGASGTYVIGVSRETSELEMEADRFNKYLEHDGILGMLQQRKEQNTLDQNSVERYAKHGKTIFQVGDERTNDWQTVLDYPIEFVPLENPYDKFTGDSLRVQLMLDGKPLADQLVYADYKPTGAHTHNDASHDHDSDDGSKAHTHDDLADENHTHDSGQKMTTNANGEVSVQLQNDGIYYLRTIHMVEVDDESELTHRSKWATLSFEVSHKHGTDTHTHDEEDHDHDSGFPIWMFIVGSIVIIGILFLIFRKSK